MIALGLLLSVAVPLIAGLPWILILQRDRQLGNWPLALAYGYVLGLLIAIVWMRVLDVVHAPANLLTIIAIPALAAIAGWRKLRGRLHWARDAAHASKLTWASMNRTTRMVVIVVIGLIAFRLLTLGAEIVIRPIFPWEAVSAVAAKARVWYDLGSIARFVPPPALLEGIGSYTDADASAYALPSLLLAFTAHMLGQWHEGAVAFPWWMMGLAMVLALYGHVRRSGAGVAFSLSVAYVFVSLPLVDLHIGLAGAPQWIAATGVGLAGCAMLRWLETPSRELLFYVVVGAALALMSLLSAWPWFVVFALSAAMARWPRYARKLAIGIPLVLLFALLAWQQTPFKWGGSTLQLQVVTTWSESIESLFLLDNWHLLYGASILVAVLGWRFIVAPSWRARSWLVGMGVVVLFVWGAVAVPGIWFGGLRDFSYAALQFAPILVLWTALAARAMAIPPAHIEPAVPETPVAAPAMAAAQSVDPITAPAFGLAVDPVAGPDTSQGTRPTTGPATTLGP